MNETIDYCLANGIYPSHPVEHSDISFRMPDPNPGPFTRKLIEMMKRAMRRPNWDCYSWEILEQLD